MPTAKNSNARKRVARRRNGLRVEDGQERRATIDVLPDEVLLEVFNFYVYRPYPVDGWRTLVHVCERWRRVVFASPHRLNLQLLCTNTRRVKKLLDIWPALPIVIEGGDTRSRHWGVTHIIAALKHNDRVCEIYIRDIPSPLLKRIAAMKKRFPALAYLHLWSSDPSAPVLPDSFLGGSAPRLRTLKLDNIPYPGLPKLLLSAHHLVELRLWNIPHSRYISPEAMVTCLSSLTSLKELTLGFRSTGSRPGQINRRPPPLTRTVLPALTYLSFRGISEYLEVLLSRIDTPLLNDTYITLFNQLILDTPQLRDYIRRTETFKALHRADILFFNDLILVALGREGTANRAVLQLGISCNASDWQLSSLTQVCSSSLPPLPTLERLNVVEYRRSSWQDDMENTQWLELLHPFVGVKNLYLAKEIASRISPALQELAGERGLEVLPALQNIFVQALQPSGPVLEAIEQFIAARLALDQLVVAYDWDGKRYQ